MKEPNLVYNPSIALASSGLSDKDLLYIADAVLMAEQVDDAKTSGYFSRHKSRGDMTAALTRALSIRNIDADTGIKTITSTVDLLA